MKKYFFYWMAFLLLFSCQDPYENENFVVYDLFPAATYLNSREDEFSQWIELLKYADMYNAVNQASRTFTVFVPTNAAVDAFLASKGVSEVSELTKTYAQALVRFHLIEGEISQKEFLVGGKLTKTTVSGDYLEVTFGDDETGEGGINSVYVNNEALVTEFANEVTNGYIYVLDAVLTPLVETVYDRLAENPDYSIFTDAVEATGFDKRLSVVYDTLENEYGGTSIVKRNFTSFPVSNSTFGAAGVASLADLISKLGAGSDYTATENALYQYVAYHSMSATRYIADLFTFADGDSSAIWSSLAQSQVISTHFYNGVQYLNYDDDTNMGLGLVAGKVDNVAKNGILHEVNNYMPIFEPKPKTIIWDLCDYDDVASFVNAYGENAGVGDMYQIIQSAEYKVTFSSNSVTSYVWKANTSASIGSYPACGYLITKSNDGGLTNTYGAYKNDMLFLNLGYLGYVNFPTPVVLKGKYKVELFYACAGSLSDFINGGSLVKVSFDDELSREVHVYDGASASVGIYGMSLFDEIEFDETASHDFKVVLLDSRATTHSSYRLQLDYIKFTPINE